MRRAIPWMPLAVRRRKNGSQKNAGGKFSPEQGDANTSEITAEELQKI
jgi:hypothetical protein